MNKVDILSRNRKSHEEFTSFIMSLEELDYNYGHQGVKWNAGQQMDHIYRSVHILANALKKPKIALRLKFGKANRPSKSYDGLVDKYKRGLASGVKSVGPYIPEIVEFNHRQAWCNKLMQDIMVMENRIGKYSKKNLDTIILPHPALGKLTMREIMYFTIHHVAHHLEIMQGNIRERSSKSR